MITLSEYFMGRDVTHAGELTPDVAANAQRTVTRVSTLLEIAARDGVEPGIDQVTGTEVASGWRPAGVNARTANAAANSKHLTAEACDLQDTPGRTLAIWCLAHLDVLEALDLYMERPQWCAGHGDPWVHLQTRAPRSGKQVFIPSNAPPQAPPLPGEPQP
jgi:hypothetical protein